MIAITLLLARDESSSGSSVIRGRCLVQHASPHDRPRALQRSPWREDPAPVRQGSDRILHPAPSARNLKPAVAARWFRDPTVPLPRHELTRFPHAVLEVKLSLPEGQKAPEWVQSLLASGMLSEVRCNSLYCLFFCCTCHAESPMFRGRTPSYQEIPYQGGSSPDTSQLN